MSENTSTSERKKPMSASAFFARYFDGKMPQEAINEGITISPARARRLMIDYANHVANESGKATASEVRFNARVSGTGDSAKGYKIFDMDYFDIALDDMPGKDKLIICKDPQNRIKEGNWAVVKQHDERGEKPPTAIALFWELAEAEKFAKKY